MSHDKGTSKMNFSKFDNTPFCPSKHSYTLYSVDGDTNSIYIESDIHGDELAIKYTFDDEGELLDCKGSACFSDAFSNALAHHIGVKSWV